MGKRRRSPQEEAIENVSSAGTGGQIQTQTENQEIDPAVETPVQEPSRETLSAQKKQEEVAIKEQEIIKSTEKGLFPSAYPPLFATRPGVFSNKRHKIKLPPFLELVVNEPLMKNQSMTLKAKVYMGIALALLGNTHINGVVSSFPEEENIPQWNKRKFNTLKTVGRALRRNSFVRYAAAAAAVLKNANQFIEDLDTENGFEDLVSKVALGQIAKSRATPREQILMDNYNSYNSRMSVNTIGKSWVLKPTQVKKVEEIFTSLEYKELTGIPTEKIVENYISLLKNEFISVTIGSSTITNLLVLNDGVNLNIERLANSNIKIVLEGTDEKLKDPYTDVNIYENITDIEINLMTRLNNVDIRIYRTRNQEKIRTYSNKSLRATIIRQGSTSIVI